MNDGEYDDKWRTVAAQLHELERAAGIGDAASSWRDAMPLSTRPAQEFGSDGISEEHAGAPHLFPLDAVRRRELRELYFSVSPAALSKSSLPSSANSSSSSARGLAPASRMPGGNSNHSSIGRQKAGGSRPSSARVW
ncbi:MAG TPA: hypothetical protein VGT81_06880 [Casimicrobiaceae bacterium]|nr:hypothetical protein [Casimicrobiaceae bacterium]